MAKSIDRVIDDFMGQNDSSLWVKWGSMRLYLRKRPYFTVASVELPEKLRGKGRFTIFLDYVESRFEAIYIEQVLNERLRVFLIKRGYDEYKPVNFVKRRKL